LNWPPAQQGHEQPWLLRFVLYMTVIFGCWPSWCGRWV